MITAPTDKPVTHFDALDGFRGLAALFILLFHSLLPWFRPLWIGVPMFFVLSGFLITRILVTNKEAEGYLKVFYTKRALRIFPIYYLVLLISVFWALLVQASFNNFPLFLFYLQNFTIAANAQPDYCYGLVNHTWSLSVEELFYLAWPLIVLAVRPRTLFTITWLIGLGCILYKIILLCFFYDKFTDQLLLLSLAGNLDGLMAGALLGLYSLNANSFLYRSFPRAQALAVLILFAGIFTASYFRFDQPLITSFFKQSLSVAAVILSFYGLAWFIRTSASPSLLNSFFQNSFLRFTGKISYGLYVYHALIFGILDAICYHYKISVGGTGLFIIKLGLSYAAAALSWSWIEKPVLAWKKTFHYGAKKPGAL